MRWPSQPQEQPWPPLCCRDSGNAKLRTLWRSGPRPGPWGLPGGEYGQTSGRAQPCRPILSEGEVGHHRGCGGQGGAVRPCCLAASQRTPETAPAGFEKGSWSTSRRTRLSQRRCGAFFAWRPSYHTPRYRIRHMKQAMHMAAIRLRAQRAARPPRHPDEWFARVTRLWQSVRIAQRAVAQQIAALCLWRESRVILSGAGHAWQEVRPLSSLHRLEARQHELAAERATIQIHWVEPAERGIVQNAGRPGAAARQTEKHQRVRPHLDDISKQTANDKDTRGTRRSMRPTTCTSAFTTHAERHR